MENKRRGHRDHGGRIILAGIAVAVFYWIFESFIHVAVFRELSFIDQVFTSDPNELWMRSVVVVLVIAFSFYFRFVYEKERKTDEELRGGERFLQDIFDSIQDGISVLDKDFNIVRVNRWINEIYGDNSLIIGKKCYKIYQKRESVCPWCPSLKALETGEVQSLITPYPYEERPTGWNFLSCYPLKDESGMVVGVIEYVKDVTELKRKEEELRLSEINYSEIFNNADDAIFIHDPTTGKLLDVNRKMCEMYGYSPDEIVDMEVGDMSENKPPYTQRYAVKWMKRAIKGEPQLFEWRAKNKTGRLFWVEVNLKRVTIGEELRLLAIVRDITERKKAEEALRRSEERFRQVAENAQEWIWETNQDGLYTYASPMAEKILGYKPEEIVGKKYFYDFFHSEDREPLKKDTLKVFAEKETFREFVNRNICKDGRTIWLSTSTVPILDDNGDLMGYRGADTDITERRKIEQMRYNLIRDVSHSLKTPIVTAKMANNEIKMAIESDDIEKAKEFQMMIQGNIDKAYRDISNILELYSLEEGKPAKLKGSISLKKVLDKVILGIKDIAGYKKLKLITDIPEDADMVLINEKELNTLLSNVLDNAVKFTDKGHITVLAKAEGEIVELRVEDTGCGILDEEKDKVFDKFYQRSAALSGVGLGLSICMEIVHRYNAKIEIVSEGKGKGTHVIISLPKG